MAFKKTFALPNGVTGNYVRATYYHTDRIAREASAHFHLFMSPELANSSPTSPLLPFKAKLRLTGASFDKYLGPTALNAAGGDALKQIYTAARTEPIICDYPPEMGKLTIFSDAEDV